MDGFFRNEQAKTGALFTFARVEQGKNFFDFLWVHANAGVCDSKFNTVLVPAEGQADFVPGLLCVCEACIHSIVDDIDKRRVEDAVVGKKINFFCREFSFQDNTMGICLWAGDPDQVFKKLTGLDQFGLKFPFLGVKKDIQDDFFHFAGHLPDHLKTFFSLVLILFLQGRVQHINTAVKPGQESFDAVGY